MSDHEAVLAAVADYCQGVYRGDIALLRKVFHPKAALFAEVRGQPYYRPLEEYLEVVAKRESPQAKGEALRMKPIGVEVTHEIAFAKVSCPMYEYHYLDFLSFVRLDGRWRIVNKLFTDLPAQRACRDQAGPA
jgi:hypothetical protein